MNRAIVCIPTHFQSYRLYHVRLLFYLIFLVCCEIEASIFVFSNTRLCLFFTSTLFDPSVQMTTDDQDI